MNVFWNSYFRGAKKMEERNQSEQNKIVFTELYNIFFQIWFIIFHCRITSLSLVTFGMVHPVCLVFPFRDSIPNFNQIGWKMPKLCTFFTFRPVGWLGRLGWSDHKNCIECKAPYPSTTSHQIWTKSVEVWKKLSIFQNDHDNDNDDDTHPPWIIVWVGMIFRRGQKVVSIGHFSLSHCNFFHLLDISGTTYI